jgi:opacity protein-like surface antigen
VRLICVLAFFAMLACSQAAVQTAAAQAAPAQTGNESSYYARRNSFGVIAAYSPDSSHVILGVAEQRKLWFIGGSYSRRLFIKSDVNWQYDGELLPLALEGDPNSRAVIHETSPTTMTVVLDGDPPVWCAVLTGDYNFTDQNGTVHSGTFSQFCHGRQWTAGQAMSPLGMQWNFLSRHKIQPLFTAHIGYLYTTKPVPVAFAGSFNFTFDFGAGVELYRSRTRSVRVEYRFPHISNHTSATENPGIDSGLFQVGYVFGR